MDFTTQEWLTALILLLIAGIFLDGFRRMRGAHRDSLHMSLDAKNIPEDQQQDVNYGSEFPNGGSRVSEQGIDEQRIAKVRSQYDFGENLTIAGVTNDSNDDGEHSVLYNSDQWVDSDEGDEEYYGKKWDDDYDFDADASSQNTADVDTSFKESSTDAQVEEVSNAQDAAPIVAERAVQQDVDIGEAGEYSSESLISARRTSEQVPLHLEESVPVLMDAEEDVQATDDSHAPLLGDLNDGLEIRPVAKSLKRNIEPTVGDSNNLNEMSSDGLDTRSANKPRYESKYFASKPDKAEQNIQPELQEVLILHVKAVDGHSFHGADLLQQVLENGLRYGAMDIFHYHSDEDGEGPVIFSMANMLKPGVFKLKTMNDFTTVGVTFFLTLPVVDNANMAAFDAMLTIAKNIAQQLGGELKDDQRSVLTAQTVEHYREKVRDFARRQQLEKNK